MQRYVSGDILRLASSIIDAIPMINSQRIDILLVTIRNNVLRVSISEPWTIFFDLDFGGIENNESSLCFVPDMLFGQGNQQIEKAYYQKIITKFYGWNSEDDIMASFTNPELGESWLEADNETRVGTIQEWAEIHSTERLAAIEELKKYRIGCHGI